MLPFTYLKPKRLYIASLFAFALLALPSLALAGSQTYSSPGAYSFTVPGYSSLSVQAWGAGGGGGGSYNSNGGAGGYSAFGSVVGYGGGGGTAGVLFVSQGYGGAGGGASGGSTNLSGSSGGNGDGTYSGPGGDSPYGGSGGQGGSWWSSTVSNGDGSAGGFPGGGGGGGGTGTSCCPTGGGGGGGGYAAYTYSSGQLTPGAGVTIVVGSSGAGGYAGSAGSGANGANGQVSISWTDPPPASCSVWFDTNPIAYGASAILHWSSSNADSWVYISNIGYVAASGAMSVGPLSTTNYSCEAYGSGGTDGWHNGILTVNSPANCTFNGQTIAHSTSVTAYQSSTVPYGSSCVSQTRTCSNGSLSGSYAFASCDVGPQCSLSLNPASVIRGQSSTLSWVSQNATSCTGDNFSTGNNTSGSTSVSPTQTTTYTGSCTGAAGTAQCNVGAGATLAVSCTPETSYSCSGNNVVETSTSSACAVTTTTPYAICTLPAFCSSGSSTCYNPTPVFGTHLQARPRIVKKGETVRLYWNVSNVLSCTVSGNQETKNGVTAGASGTTTRSINSQAIYILTCLKLPDGSSSISEQQTVNIVPEFDER